MAAAGDSPGLGADVDAEHVPQLLVQCLGQRPVVGGGEMYALIETAASEECAGHTGLGFVAAGGDGAHQEVPIHP